MALPIFLRRKLFFAIVFFVISISHEQPIAGPFDVILDQAEECPESMLDYSFPLSIHLRRDRKVAKIFYVQANYTTLSDISDNKNAMVTFASWSSRGGWKENAIVMKFKKLCSSVKLHLPSVWREVIRTLTYQPTDSTLRATNNDCPFQSGSFSHKNISSASIIVEALPVMFYGKWRVDLKAFEALSKKTFMCMRAYIRIDPKTDAHHIR